MVAVWTLGVIASNAPKIDEDGPVATPCKDNGVKWAASSDENHVA